MPTSMVKTEQDEKDWKRAKKIVEEQYGGLEGRWPLVTHIFKNIQKGHKKASILRVAISYLARKPWLSR